MTIFNPFSMPNFMAPRAHGPIARMTGNAPGVGGGGAVGGSSGILAFEDWSSTPGATWLATPTGPVGTNSFWEQSKFGNAALAAGDVLDMSYLSGVAPDGSGVIRSAKPSNWNNANNATNMYFSTSFAGIFGTHNFRNGAYRGLLRHSGSPFMYDAHAGKLQYLQMQAPRFTFTSSDISGHQTLTATNTWTLNTSTGYYEGTATTGLTNIINGSVLLPLTGNMVGVLESRPLVVVSYNPSSGSIVVRAAMNWGSPNIPGYLTDPASGSTFAVVFNMAEAVVTDSLYSGNILYIESTGLGWNVYIANDTHTYIATNAASIVTQTHGVTLSATVQSASARFESNLYRDPATWEPGSLHCQGANNITAFQLEYTGWHLATNGDAKMTANSVFNLAKNTNYFYFIDHSDEFYLVEFVLNVEQNPWHSEVWVTTAWGAQNLSAGTAGTRPGSTSAFGGEITHYNNYKLYEYEYPAPALTLSSGSQSGMTIEWGSLAGNDYDTAPVGIYSDIGRFDVAEARIGTTNLW